MEERKILVDKVAEAKGRAVWAKEIAAWDNDEAEVMPAACL